MTFDETFRRFHKQLCYYATNILHDKDEAKDLVQNVFIKYWQLDYGGTEKGREQLLYKMVRYACLDNLKGIVKQIHPIPIEESYDVADEEYQNVAFLAEVESMLVADICAQVPTLPRKCRKVFELSYYLGKTTKEISEFLHISKQNVLNQKQRALQLLRIQLKL